VVEASRGCRPGVATPSLVFISRFGSKPCAHRELSRLRLLPCGRLRPRAGSGHRGPAGIRREGRSPAMRPGRALLHHRRLRRANPRRARLLFPVRTGREQGCPFTAPSPDSCAGGTCGTVRISGESRPPAPTPGCAVGVPSAVAALPGDQVDLGGQLSIGIAPAGLLLRSEKRVEVARIDALVA